MIECIPPTVEQQFKKNDVAIDPQSNYAEDALVEVYSDMENNIYSVVLTRTDVEEQKNCFHKLQVLVSHVRFVYFVLYTTSPFIH